MQTSLPLHSFPCDNFKALAAFSPDGRKIATASNDNLVRLWDSTTGMLLHSFPLETGILSIAFSPDSNQLLIGSFSRTAIILNLKDLEEIRLCINRPNLDQCDLLQAFDMAIFDANKAQRGRIQATHKQWENFISLPPLVQARLRLYIKQPEKIDWKMIANKSSTP